MRFVLRIAILTLGLVTVTGCYSIRGDDDDDTTGGGGDDDDDTSNGDPLPCLVECGDLDGDLDGWFAAEDCDDDDPAVNPGQIEDVCCWGDGKDNDCDGLVDESVDADSECGRPCDVDQDGDGFPATEDCDDADPAQNPGANEYCCPCGSGEAFPYPQCNGEDDDCDGAVDETSNLQEEDEFCCNSG